MTRYLIISIVAISVVLLACGGGGSRDETITDGSDLSLEGIGREEVGGTLYQSEPAAFPIMNGDAIEMLAADEGAMASGGFTSASITLETTERQVISTASVSLEVEDVRAAVSQVRLVAESLGGFVEQLSSSGDPDRSQATMTVRVPQLQFFTALVEIEELGEVRRENVGSEDVSEQFIDLEAHLKSSLRQEQSLLSLLEKTQTVGEILALERELSRVRAEIERLQGQINFLERRVELATISVTLFPPEEEVVEPPSASLSIGVSDVGRALDEIKQSVSTLDGVVDRSILSVREGKDSAILSLRVFRSDFQAALSFIENQGKVQSKELQETGASQDSEAALPDEPDARIGLSLVEEENTSNTGVIVAIAAPIGSVALIVLLATLFYLTYRAGRRGRPTI